jgi:hypothetical protein
MKKGTSKMKRHIISMRISTEELDYLHQVMRGQQLKSVSALMRQAFNQVLAPSLPGEDAVTKGPHRIG